MANVALTEARNLNPVTILGNRYLIIENPAEALPELVKRVTK